MTAVLAAATYADAPAKATTSPASGGAPASTTTPAADAARVETVVPRRRKVIRRRFKPAARPSPAKVRRIIRIEAARWHISAAGLARRVSCESGYSWSAGNGTYRGLLQFAPSTFSRGMSTIKSRTVKIVKRSTRTVREKRIVHYPDGKVAHLRGKKHRQRVIRVLKGKLPRHPALTHGWAQLRIGAQAIAGRSAVSSGEWSCGA